MKKLLLFLPVLCSVIQLCAQNKPAGSMPGTGTHLPDFIKCMIDVQGHVPLYTQNINNNALEHDVNSIILDIEKYIDSMPKTRGYSDVLLMKEFNPLRHFFLTTTNKTAVATSFLYTDKPYQFCLYNDTAKVLYTYAINDGETYNLNKMTEKKAVKSAVENCLLPSLKAFDEFKDNEIKYAGLSVYYGCKDTREGAPKEPLAPYCLTLIARLTDIQQYAAGLITDKGLMANAEVYICGPDDSSMVRKIQINLE